MAFTHQIAVHGGGAGGAGLRAARRGGVLVIEPQVRVVKALRRRVHTTLLSHSK